MHPRLSVMQPAQPSAPLLSPKRTAPPVSSSGKHTGFLGLAVAAALLCCGLLPLAARAAEVALGAGSYTDTKPAGAAEPQAAIYRTAAVTGPMPTNKWWSSLAWQTFSKNQYPHPLSVCNTATGFQVWYPGPTMVASTNSIIAGKTGTDFTIGHSAVSAFADAKVDGYSDWFVSSLLASGSNLMRVSYGLGSPYIFVRYTGGNARLTFPQAPAVWSGGASSSVLGITINGKHYGLFGPTGSSWSGLGGSVLTNEMGGRAYFCVAVLPEASTTALDKFRQYAYSHITRTTAAWRYEPATSDVVTDYQVEVEPMETGAPAGTIFALYPHQWRNVSSAQFLSAYSYPSIRGTMKVAEGPSFQTRMRFCGVLPSLPDCGSYDRTRLTNYVNADAQTAIPTNSDTYDTGKALGKLAQLAPIAEQMGQTQAVTTLHNNLKGSLQDWLKASSGETSRVFYYNSNWGVLLGYPGGYGSVDNVNDHHFHYGYYIKAAAEIARKDPTWASQQQWGAMVEMILRDYGAGRGDPLFPYARNFEPYAGHSWANGSAPFDDGPDMESSSEAVNAWAAIILWGEATGNTALRDRGIYLYTTEVSASQEYWHNVHRTNFLAGYPHPVATMVWAGKIDYATWWPTGHVEKFAITWLPYTAASLYLGQYPDYVRLASADLLAKNNGSTDWSIWSDMVWMYQALGNPQAALTQMEANINSSGAGEKYIERGNTRTNTYHWIHNLNVLGEVDRTVSANHPNVAVFTKNGQRTYVAYNYGATAKLVTFTDGRSLLTPARSMATTSGCDDFTLSAVKITGPTTVTLGQQIELTVTGRSSCQPLPLDGATILWSAAVAPRNTATVRLTGTALGSVPVTVSVTASGSTFTDQISVSVVPEPQTIRLEAESFLRQSGGVQIENTGRSIGYFDAAGRSVTYTVTAPRAGRYELYMRYASSGAGTLSIAIPGQANQTLAFANTFTGTGSWWTQPIDGWPVSAKSLVDLPAGTFEMTLAYTATALNIDWFELARVVTQRTLTLTANPAAAGAPTGAGQYEAGTSVPLAANTGSGYRLVGWYKAGVQIGTTTPFAFTMPAADTALEARYEETRATYLDWSFHSFSAADLANPALSGIDADPDGVGLTNFHRFAHNLPARGPVPSPVTTDTITDAGQRYITLSFDRRSDAAALTYTVESSTDLITWTQVQSINPGLPIRVTVRDAGPLSTGDRRFLRLRVINN